MSVREISEAEWESIEATLNENPKVQKKSFNHGGSKPLTVREAQIAAFQEKADLVGIVAQTIEDFLDMTGQEV